MTGPTPPTPPLTLLDVSLDGERVGIRTENDVITEIGRNVVARPGEQVLSGEGMAVLPGLVNAHCHAPMTLLRGYGDDLPLMEWLETMIWPAEAKLDADDVYWGARLAAIEMLRSGTTHFFDMYWHGSAVARAASDAGIRATVSTVFIDGQDPDRGSAQRSEAIDELDAIADAGPLVRASLGPHAVYTVSRESLEWIASLADERKVPVQIHLSETEEEVTACRERTSLRPPEFLDACGLLTDRTICAHANWLESDEFDLLAARGVTVATNPVSNLKLTTGRTFDYPMARARSMRIGLGTDGASSNNGLDLLGDLKILSLVQKFLSGDPSVLPADEALDIALGRHSPLLDGGQAGNPLLEVGSRADFVLIRTESPELTPSPISAGVVYGTASGAVDTVVVAGRVVMRGREVEGTDEVLAQVRERSRRLRNG